MPALSPQMHLNLCSPGPAPQTTCSPNLVPLRSQNLHHLFHFCSFLFKIFPSFPTGELGLVAHILETIYLQLLSGLSSHLSLCSFQDAPNRKENDNTADPLFTQMSGHYLQQNRAGHISREEGETQQCGQGFSFKNATPLPSLTPMQRAKH